MKSFILLFGIIILMNLQVFAQIDYEKQVEYFANDIVKKIASNKIKVAVVDFKNNDDEITQFTRLIAEDISLELAMSDTSKSKLQIVERNSLKSILNDLKLSSNRDESKIARELGKKAIADVLITGTVTLFGDNYRVAIKVIDTENGNIITASKGSVVKTDALEDLHKKIIEKGIGKIETKLAVPDAKSEKEEVPLGEKGWLTIDNKSNAVLTVYISTNKSVQQKQTTNADQVTVSSNTIETVPSLEPNIYYICATYGETDPICRITKKVEIKSGKGSRVVLDF